MDRTGIVRRLLFEYVQSPSLRHIRDGNAVFRLAAEIVGQLDRGTSAWLKWSGPREELVKAAAPCWVPIVDLVEHLNAMTGPPLTTTDVEQRTRAFKEEGAAEYPVEELREECLARLAREQADGTELPAIVGVLQELVEAGEARLRGDRQARHRSTQDAKRRALEDRFVAGADCKWTPIGGSKALFCRANGRVYRLSHMPEGVWELYRVKETNDRGVYVGRYCRRRDATAAIANVAYGPDLLRP